MDMAEMEKRVLELEMRLARLDEMDLEEKMPTGGIFSSAGVEHPYEPPVKQHKHMFLNGGATCDDCTMGVAEVIRELETDISELKLYLPKM
jgi:hypothetical protein